MIAVTNCSDVFLHAFLAHPSREFLVVPHHRVGNGGSQGVILIPRRNIVKRAIPLDYGVLIGDDARFQADQRVENLERRGGQEALRRSIRVVAQDVIAFQIDQHKSARLTVEVFP